MQHTKDFSKCLQRLPVMGSICILLSIRTTTLTTLSTWFLKVSRSCITVRKDTGASTPYTQPGPVIYADEHFTSKNKGKDKNKLRKLPKTNGFRLIQGAQQTSTLVAGKDGRIYLVSNSAE